MKVEFEKSYNWTQLEDQWYARWLKKDYFTGDENSSNESFSIVIPPPNITGKLTMGHVPVSYTHLTLPTNVQV